MFAKKKLRRQDFLLEDGWFESLVRRPGQLHMQQFQISDCQECTIALFDAAACVYIDQCKFCTVFVGACEASVFVRDCLNTTVICTSQQFRVRECFDCHFSIFCESQPIIQSSKGITISNFPMFGYSELLDQMKQAKTSPWNNNWFDIYDFTPNKYHTQNYQLITMDKNNKDLLKVKDLLEQTQLAQNQGVIPRSLGKGNYEANDFAVLVAYPVPLPVVSQQLELLQSKVHYITSEEIQKLGMKVQCEGRVKILFVKVLRKVFKGWKKYLKNVIFEVEDQKMLQFYQQTVFAPFRDEH